MVYFLLSAIISLEGLIIYYFSGSAPTTLLYGLVFALLSIATYNDFLTKRVDDFLNFGALAIALLAVFVLPELAVYRIELILTGVFSALVAIGLRALMTKILGRESMGEADIVLLATMGMMLGFVGTLVAVAFGSFILIIVASASKNKEAEFPFFPFLTSAAFVVFIALPLIPTWLRF